MDMIISKLILSWAKDTFGPVALDPRERAMRLLEEAAELAQAEGVTVDEMCNIVERTCARPVGDPFKELGGVLVTIHGYAAVKNISIDAALLTEVVRVTGRDKGEWLKKHNAKVVDGTATVPECPYCKEKKGYVDRDGIMMCVACGEAVSQL